MTKAPSKNQEKSEETTVNTQPDTTPKEAPQPVQQPVTQPNQPVASAERLSRLKLAFLYILIVGLSLAALTSIIALLVGNFSGVIGKALLTIFIFFTHSLVVLGILWADRDNEVGKKLLPSTIALLVFANMITTTLGTWEIMSTEYAWRAFGLYFLLIGGVYTIAGALRLRVSQQAAQIALYSSTSLIAVTVLAVAPWVLNIVPDFQPLYFRIVGALAILTATSFLIALILRGIALSKGAAKEFDATRVIPGGMLAVYITVGVFTSMIWFGGFIQFISDGMQASSQHRTYDLNDTPTLNRGQNNIRRY